MKRLKDSTIKSYNAYQLAKHLDRLMDLHEDAAPYRVDLYYGCIYELEYGCSNGVNRDSYVTLCGLHDGNKDLIIDAIESEYIHWGVYSKQGETITTTAN